MVEYTHDESNIFALADGQEFGYLQFEDDGDDTVFVAALGVKPEYQRQGIATQLCEYLRDVLNLRPTFAPPGCGDSEDGEHFKSAWLAKQTTPAPASSGLGDTKFLSTLKGGVSFGGNR